MLDNRLVDAITDFRNAIVKTALIDTFPQGACLSATTLLARYLMDYYSVELNRFSFLWTETNKYFPGYMSHTWFAIDGINVDITASQFEFIANEIIISDEWYLGNYFQFPPNESRFNTYEFFQLIEQYKSIAKVANGI